MASSWCGPRDYPDYYPELPGGKVGRAVEVKPFDVKRIGTAWDTCQAPVAMPIKTDDVWLLGRAWSTPGGLARGARLVFRTIGAVARGQRVAGIGAAFAAAFFDVVVQQQHASLWLDSPLEELVIEDDRVVGVRTTRGGRPVGVRARHGVMLAGGGFDQNKAVAAEVPRNRRFTVRRPGQPRWSHRHRRRRRCRPPADG